jgi:Arc/MetJ family transcription regulator
MRTNIVLDERLVRDALKLTGAKTMREVVDMALRQLVRTRRQRRLLELRGTGGVHPDYDYKKARSGD